MCLLHLADFQTPKLASFCKNTYYAHSFSRRFASNFNMLFQFLEIRLLKVQSLDNWPLTQQKEETVY